MVRRIPTIPVCEPVGLIYPHAPSSVKAAGYVALLTADTDEVMIMGESALWTSIFGESNMGEFFSFDIEVVSATIGLYSLCATGHGGLVIAAMLAKPVSFQVCCSYLVRAPQVVDGKDDDDEDYGGDDDDPVWGFQAQRDTKDQDDVIATPVQLHPKYLWWMSEGLVGLVGHLATDERALKALRSCPSFGRACEQLAVIGKEIHGQTPALRSLARTCKRLRAVLAPDGPAAGEGGQPPASLAKERACAQCGAVEEAGRKERLKKCTGCRTVSYCNVDCQRAHWRAGHKAACQAAGKANAA